MVVLVKGFKINRVLRSVFFFWNSILNEGVLEIGKVLKVNRKLKVLDVINCGFNEIGVENILEGLCKNIVLEVFRIGWNIIYDYGVYKIFKLIRKFLLSVLK